MHPEFLASVHHCIIIQRVPVWTNSDDEELTPVKGSHMLTSPRAAKPSAAGGLVDTFIWLNDPRG